MKDWTRKITAEDVQSQAIMKCIYAEKKCAEGKKREAMVLYERALQTLEVPRTYLAPYSVFILGWLDLNILEEVYASGNPLFGAFPSYAGLCY